MNSTMLAPFVRCFRGTGGARIRSLPPLCSRYFASDSQRKKTFDLKMYLVTDDKYFDDSMEQKIIASVQAGATMVQLRLKKCSTRQYVNAARSLKKAMDAAGFNHVPLIIDDRLDVCLAADYDGLHVGDGDMDVASARRILGDNKIIGSSTYGRADFVQEAKAGGADYVAGGGVASSSTKKYATKGTTHLHDFKYHIVGQDMPVCAIGGLDESNVWDTIYSGADGAACVSHLLGCSSPTETAANTANMVRLIEDATHAKRRAKSNDTENPQSGEKLWDALEKMRGSSPLVHCITNYVSMDIMANVLLAAGMSPAMVHTQKEAAEFAGIASAVSINVGTLSPPWTEAFLEVADVCRAKGTPWVLDPVGVGAISYRTGVVKELLQKKPTVLRGNPSEIMACAQLLGIDTANVGGSPRGVDSTLDASAVNPAVADAIAKETGGVVVMTGPTDVISGGTPDSQFLALHACPGLQAITAAGCSLSSLIGGFVASAGDDSPQARAEAAAQACAFFTLAGQQAARKSAGPGSLRVNLMDSLQNLDRQTVRALTRIEKFRL